MTHDTTMEEECNCGGKKINGQCTKEIIDLEEERIFSEKYMELVKKGDMDLMYDFGVQMGLEKSTCDERIKQAVMEREEELIKGIEEEKYDEDVEDLGGEAIANTAYENKFEAFRYGYNEAIKKVLARLSPSIGEDKKL